MAPLSLPGFVMSSDAYDIVIIGGGTAGLIVAARLSEDPGLQVAVLESGEDDSSNPNLQTPGLHASLRNGPLDWGFKSTYPVSFSPLSMHAFTKTMLSSHHMAIDHFL